LEGNAGGDILACDAPHLLKVTFGDVTSVVTLHLSPDSDDTSLELEHTVPLTLAGSGAGALFVGPGWDGAFLGLGLLLRGEVADDLVAAANSSEAQEFSLGSIDAWTTAVAGTATEDEITAATEVSRAQFSPDTNS
jgi:hypothetical protein